MGNNNPFQSSNRIYRNANQIQGRWPNAEVDTDESSRIAPGPRAAAFDSPPSFLEKPEPAEAPAAPSDRSNLQLYLQEIGKTALLTIDEEISLAKRIRRGDKAARDHMIKANLRLVVKIAMDYKDFGLPLLDLISEGNIGLVKAVERFDPRKGGKLSTYAAWWIKQSIKRALANQSKTIRLPVHLVDKISKMRKMAMVLSEGLGREPTDEELAMELQIPTSKVAHLKSVSVRPASLDAPIGEDGDSATFGEIVGDENAVSPYENLRGQEPQLGPARHGGLARQARGGDHPAAVRPRRPQRAHARGGRPQRSTSRASASASSSTSRSARCAGRWPSNEAVRTADDVEQEDRQRKRMTVIREFIESKSKKDASRLEQLKPAPGAVSAQTHSTIRLQKERLPGYPGRPFNCNGRRVRPAMVAYSPFLEASSRMSPRFIMSLLALRFSAS